MKRNRFVFITILICFFAFAATSCDKPFAGLSSSNESKAGSSNVSAESSSSSASSLSASQAASASAAASSSAAAQSAQQSAAQAASTAAPAANTQTATPAATPAAPAAPAWPASGEVPGAYYVPNLDGQRPFSNSAVYIDLSYTSYGFVKVHLLQASASRIKVRIQSSGTYDYDLKTDGSTEIYPLQMGSGNYTISVYQNISGQSYAALGSTSFSVGLNRSDAPYLVPSQIVNYTSGSSVASIARSLVSGKSNNYERISAVCDYVASHIHYNYGLAKTVQAGYVPNIDAVLSSGSGICYDYAAVAAAMLRTLGYPTKLVMGYVDGNVYHAWNEVYISGQGWIKVMSVTLNTSEWSRVDCTFISTSTSPAAIAQYIGNSSNYQTVYIY